MNILNPYKQQQHMIELIRENKVEEALDFAQTHLAEKGLENSEMLPEIECTLALLAFPNPELSPFGELLEIDHRKKVVLMFFYLEFFISAIDVKPTTFHQNNILLNSLYKYLIFY